MPPTLRPTTRSLLRTIGGIALFWLLQTLVMYGISVARGQGGLAPIELGSDDGRGYYELARHWAYGVPLPADIARDRGVAYANIYPVILSTIMRWTGSDSVLLFRLLNGLVCLGGVWCAGQLVIAISHDKTAREPSRASTTSARWLMIALACYPSLCCFGFAFSLLRDGWVYSIFMACALLLLNVYTAASTTIQPKGSSSNAAVKVATPAPPAKVSFHRATLAGPEFPAGVKRLAHDVAELAGTLGERAERFFAGLEFWLRGRYGWGPDVGGLAKSSAVLEQPELMPLLYMPENLLTSRRHKESPPAGSTGKRIETKSVPEKEPTLSCLDRRHHYIWAWEDRLLATSTSGQLTREIYGIEDVGKYMAGRWGPHGSFNFPTPPGWATGSFGLKTQETEINVTVPPQDPRLVYRIVGFFEYGKSLELLDKFVGEASMPEMNIAEEIIQSQDAFRLRTNLSSKIEQLSPLSEQSNNPRGDFSRHGLEWMLALARVEIGAMLAAFTSHAEPFLSVAPTTVRTEKERVNSRPFGTDAFGELLMDGLRTHYWSVVREDVVNNYFKSGVPENHLLTYGRRAILGQQFVRAVSKFAGLGGDGSKLLPVQQEQLQAWDQTFQKVQRMVLYCLISKLGRNKVQDNQFSEVFNHHSRWITTERDQTPDMIRRLMVLADPTLAACGCQ